MTSGRQKQAQIKAKRSGKARVLATRSYEPLLDPLPYGALAADQLALAHDNTYGPRPRYYVDKAFHCRDCNVREVWTAAQQKWWYEIAKGKIGSQAVCCNACRRQQRLRSAQSRRIHIEGLIAKHGGEETAKRLKLAPVVMQRMLAAWSARSPRVDPIEQAARSEPRRIRRDLKPKT